MHVVKPRPYISRETPSYYHIRPRMLRATTSLIHYCVSAAMKADNCFEFSWNPPVDVGLAAITSAS